MVKRKVQFKKAYVDKDGLTHIPIKLKGKKKFKCDDCKKKVREVFTINPTEILLRRELCRACYCKTPESLDDLLKLVDDDKEMDSEVFVYVCDKCGESLDLDMDSKFSKIPFEGTWRCKCGNVIRIKWDGKELKYL